MALSIVEGGRGWSTLTLSGAFSLKAQLPTSLDYLVLFIRTELNIPYILQCPLRASGETGGYCTQRLCAPGCPLFSGGPNLASFDNQGSLLRPRLLRIFIDLAGGRPKILRGCARRELFFRLFPSGFVFAQGQPALIGRQATR